jgi:6-phosphogluconate dehydrogenase
MAGGCELGVPGLATMGANLARNAARHGFAVAVHNRTESRTQELPDRPGVFHTRWSQDSQEVEA